MTTVTGSKVAYVEDDIREQLEALTDEEFYFVLKKGLELLNTVKLMEQEFAQSGLVSVN